MKELVWLIFNSSMASGIVIWAILTTHKWLQLNRMRKRVLQHVEDAYRSLYGINVQKLPAEAVKSLLAEALNYLMEGR